MTQSDPDGLPVPDPDFNAKHKQAFLDYLAADSAEPDGFDLYAQDPGAWRDLSARIPGLLITSAGGACPFQVEGTLHGLDFYFRYRHGYADLRVGDAFRHHLYQSGTAFGDEWAGVLSHEEFADLMAQLVPELAPASFCYEFVGVKVDVERGEDGNLVFTPTEETCTYYGWGHSAEEAHAALDSISEYLLDHGFSEADQRRLHAAQAPRPTPLNTDERVFPDPAPVFAALPAAPAQPHRT